MKRIRSIWIMAGVVGAAGGLLHASDAARSPASRSEKTGAASPVRDGWEGIAITTFANETRHLRNLEAWLDFDRETHALSSMHVFTDTEDGIFNGELDSMARKYSETPWVSLGKSLLPRSLRQELAETSSRVIYMNGHGGHDPKGVRDGEYQAKQIVDSFILPLNREHRFRELYRALSAPGERDKRNTIVTTQCFGGTVHYLSFELPHTCSVSTVPWWRESRAGEDVPAPYLEGFLNEIRERRWDIDGDGRTSLLEAHLGGVMADDLNPVFGEISSQAYLDYALCGGFSMHYIMGSQASCLHPDHLETLDTGGYRLKGSKNVDHGVPGRTMLYPLTQEERAALPERLREFYDGAVTRGLLLHSYEENATEFTGALDLMIYLRKYAYATKVLSPEQLAVLARLTECESEPRLAVGGAP